MVPLSAFIELDSVIKISAKIQKFKTTLRLLFRRNMNIMTIDSIITVVDF